MIAADKTDIVKRLALGLGFDRIGVATLGPSPTARHYRRWLASGHAGTMTYLSRNVRLRENPALVLDGAKSAVCVAVSYKRPDPPPRNSFTVPPATGDPRGVEPKPRQGFDPPPAPPCEGGECATGRVAQYARGADYHRVLRTMLDNLLSGMREQIDEPFDARVFVDTGPILERDLAAAAGLGWIGKNTMLLHERLGSYLFLGEILTTLELAADSPATPHCGNCTACLDACPTRAFTEPYKLDASRCISYLTIEHRDEIPAEFHEQIGDWVFGCDICQEVCPFNNHAPDATHPELTADVVPAHMPLRELANLRSGEYKRLTRGSAMSRAHRKMLRRNAEIALANRRSSGVSEDA